MRTAGQDEFNSRRYAGDGVAPCLRPGSGAGTAGARRSRGRLARAYALALALVTGLVLSARPALAQIAMVQSSGLFGNPAGTTTSSSPLSPKPAVGNTIVVLVWTWTQNKAASVSVTDNAGNTYTSNVQAAIVQSTWYESASVFSAPVTMTGGGFKVTVASPGNDSSSQIRAVALEYSGVGPVDRTAAATGSSSTATVATSASTTSANELVVSALGINNPASNFSSISPSAGYTTRAVQYQNAGDTAGGGADRIVSSTGIQSITWTTSPSLSGWAAAIATFGSSSGSGSATASGFNAVDGYLAAYPAASAAQRIYTKLAATSLTLNVAALNAATPTPGLLSPGYVSGASKVAVDLVDDSDGSCASSCAGAACQAKSPVASQAVSFASADASYKTALSFLVANAYPNLRVRIKDTSSAQPVYGCSVDDFSVRPAALSLSSSANADSTGSSASAAPGVKAGKAFTLTATGTAGYSGTPSISLPALAANPPSAGTLAGSFGAANAASGAATGSFTYSEVGYFSLSADAVNDRAFTAVDQSSDFTPDYSNALVNGKYGCYFGNSGASAYFGRFIPDHFAITAGTVTPACGSFTYFDQDGIVTTFTLTAQNAFDATTRNYTGASFAKLTLSGWAGFGFTGDSATPSASATAPGGTWSNGVAAVSAKHQVLARPTATPLAPASLIISARPTDADAVSTAAATAVMASATALRFGELALGSGYGSMLLAVRMPVTAMYWNGSAWAPNTADACTGALLSNAGIARGNQVQKSGTRGAFATSVLASPTLASTWARGSGLLELSASSAPGTAQVALNLGAASTDASCIGWSVASSGMHLAWLRGNWCGSGYVGDPSSLASFGMASTAFVNLRENY